MSVIIGISDSNTTVWKEPNKHLIRLIPITNLMKEFLYSITICMLHYNPRHVSSVNIITLCKRLYSMPNESRMLCSLLSSGILYCTVLYCTESDDTSCSDNTICPLEDGHVNARNMSRIVMLHTYCYRIKEFVH